MISDKQLAKISFCLAIIGIFGLAVIAYYTEPPEVAISTISDSYLGKVVILRGITSDITTSKDVQGKVTLFFTLSDSTGSIKIVAFNNNLILEDSNIVSVIGKVSFYKEKYEIIAESVKKI